jgi:hypothetical protein
MTWTDWRAPHEFLMDTTDMQFKIVPASCHVVAGGIGTVEAQENQGVLHHLLSLERYCQLFIFERSILWSIRREGRIGGDSENNCWLSFLTFVA